MKRALIVTCFSACAILAACKKDDDSDKKKKGKSAGLALVKPPVEDSTPAGLLSASFRNFHLLTATPSEFQDRFFNPEGGPTNLFRILTDVDERVKEINTRTAGSTIACASQTPVEYTVSPLGEPITLYAQCYSNVGVPDSSDGNFYQWGKKDGITYLYTHIGAGNVAAIVTPVEGTTDKYTVDAWVSVGLTNTPAWDKMSYGVMQVKADSSTNKMEMSVAGGGFGFCGAQFKSDGTNIYFKGSADGGASCQDASDICVTAADLSATAECTEAQKEFTIPAIGRQAATGSSSTEVGASKYPETPNIILDGTETDAVHFGPTTPTSGVGQM